MKTDYKITPLRSAFNYNTDEVSEKTGLFCPEPTLTQQNTADQTDINFIVATFAKTGLLPNAIQPPTYGDFTGVSDFREAMELVQQGKDAFNQLPADTRAYFNNDPANFLDFVESGPDKAILDDLGLSAYVEPKIPDKLPENPAN